jgi:hypothetical protein
VYRRWGFRELLRFLANGRDLDAEEIVDAKRR